RRVVGEAGRTVQEQVRALRVDQRGGLSGGDVGDLLRFEDGGHGDRYGALRRAEHGDVAVAGDLPGEFGADRRVALVVVQAQLDLPAVDPARRVRLLDGEADPAPLELPQVAV